MQETGKDTAIGHISHCHLLQLLLTPPICTLAQDRTCSEVGRSHQPLDNVAFLPAMQIGEANSFAAVIQPQRISFCKLVPQ
jgi:hypothetical protein